jgi:glycerol-3-phosphate acyltransferase PlsX
MSLNDLSRLTRRELLALTAQLGGAAAQFWKRIPASAPYRHPADTGVQELVTAVEGIAAPKVGLLNIGEEEIKGNEQVKQAHELLGASALNYIGYVEGDDIYLGDVDVVVSDGFVGNVALKVSEGVAKLVRHFLTQSFKRSWLTRAAGLAALPVLRGFSRTFDPRRYNGASLLGLRGIVIKSHGGADRLAFENAIHIAEKEIHGNIPERIAHQVARHLGVDRKRASA